MDRARRLAERLASRLNQRDALLASWRDAVQRQAALRRRPWKSLDPWEQSVASGIRRVNTARQYGATCAAIAILEPSVPLTPGGALAPATTVRFRRLRTVHPLPLELEDGGGSLGLGLRSQALYAGHLARPAETGAPVFHQDYGAEVALLLWELLRSPHRDRLKRCAKCGRWFADVTNSKRMRWCSESCHNVAWSRGGELRLTTAARKSSTTPASRAIRPDIHERFASVAKRARAQERRRR